MNKESLVQFIQQVLPMSQAKAGQVAERFKPMTFERNAYVLEAGKVCNESHFIENGIIRSYTYDVDGNEVTTAFYSQNTFTNDLLSFFKRSPAKEYLQAVTGCNTWYITYEDMQASFHAIPEFREFGRLNIVNQYSILKERMLSMLQETAEQRYSNLINSSPDLFQNVPLKYIASYLGITDTSLSRIRKEFAKR